MVLLKALSSISCKWIKMTIGKKQFLTLVIRKIIQYFSNFVYRMSMMIEHIPASGNPEMPPVTEQTLPSHSNTQQVGCCLCCSVFNCKSDLILHDRTTHMALNKRYKCPYCPKILVTKKNILDHIKQSHQTEYQTFAQGECQVCHKKVLKGNLRRHSFQHIGTSKKPKNN